MAHGSTAQRGRGGRGALITCLSLLIAGAALVLGYTALVMFKVGKVGRDTDIGGGLILVAGLACLVAAAVLGVVAACGAGRPMVGVATIALCAALAGVPYVTPGRGPGTVGIAAIAKAADGTPVAVIAVCGKEISRIFLYGKERADDHRAQHPIGAWTTESANGPGIHELPLTGAATSDWQVTTPPPPLIDGWHYSVIGASRDGELSLSSAAFTLADIAPLGDGEVLTAAGTKTRDDFRAHACDRYRG
jgi:hypothetical protein